MLLAAPQADLGRVIVHPRQATDDAGIVWPVPAIGMENYVSLLLTVILIDALNMTVTREAVRVMLPVKEEREGGGGGGGCKMDVV